MPRDRGRRAEGSLLLFALAILLFGLLLVFFGRARGGVPPDAIDLNVASAQTLASVLDIDPVLAGILVEHRQLRGGFAQTHEPAILPLFPSSEAAARMRTALEQSHLDPNAADARQLVRILGVPHPVADRIVVYRATLPGARFRHPLDILRVPVVDDDTISARGNTLIVRSPVAVFTRFLFAILALLALFLIIPVLIRRRSPGGDPFLVPLTLILLALGLMIQFSVKDPYRDTPVFDHQAVGVAGGLAAMALGALLPAATRRNLRRYTYVWALAAIGLMLALWVFGLGPEGVRLSLLGIQPVEIVKLLLVLFLAGYLTTRTDLLAETMNRWRPPLPKSIAERYRGIALPRRGDVMPLLGMFAVALLMFAIVKDMGPALLLFGTFIGLLYLATGRPGVVWLGVALIALAGMLADAAHVGVIPVRVDMWRSPWVNDHRNGMQLGQALWALGSGGWSGTGLGLGAVSSHALTRAGSDLVFASLGEELGFVGTLTVLVLFSALIWRGLRVALDAQHEFDRLLAAGLTALLLSQVFLIVCGVTGLLPLSGITLPLVSYGTSSLVASCFLVGLLRGISAPTHTVPLATSNPRFARNALAFGVATGVMLLGAVGIVRLGWLQVLRSVNVAGRTITTPDADGRVRAKVNPRLLAIAHAIPRGAILDRKGRVLATSREEEMTQSGLAAAQAHRLALAGRRYYPHGPALAHLVGYADPAVGGPVGIERQCDADLRGFHDYDELVADYRGKDLPRWISGLRPRQGKDVVLTVDASLQEDAVKVLVAAAGALRDRRTGRRKDRGAMVVLDPTTGEVLVAASTPSFDPNTLTPATFQSLVADVTKANRLFDRARAGAYPPGSSLKVAIAAAGLEAGLEPTYKCDHVARDVRWSYKGVSYARKQIRDDQGDPPHGRLGMPRAMSVSCNLYFAHLALRLGPERLHEALVAPDRFALSRVQALPGMAASLPEYGFGQGTMLATPEEMARVAASVANRGVMMTPMYVKEIRDRTGKEPARPTTPVVLSQPIGQLNAGRIADMMRSVVTSGTARGVFDGLPVEVAGKTGTAQTDQGDREPHSWFIGFAPYTRPQYAFACVIENGGYGKRGAAPAVRKLLEQAFGP